MLAINQTTGRKQHLGKYCCIETLLRSLEFLIHNFKKKYNSERRKAKLSGLLSRISNSEF